MTTVVSNTFSVTVSDWQLPASNYVAAKMSMRIVHPRPDSETSSNARHRKAYPDGTAEYRIPVAVQGGAYPFYYELTAAPSGMTIGQRYGNTDYGIISWTPTTGSGPHTVTVKVTDQELNEATVTYTVTATTSGFIFIDPNTGTSGVGTKADPLKLWSDMHKDDSTDTTFSGDIVYLRGGTHTLDGFTANSNNLELTNGTHPQTYLGYSGESVIVNCASSKINVFSPASADWFCGGFRMTESRTDVNNSHFWFFGGSVQDRVTFFEMDFDDVDRGLVGSDNPAAITFFNPGTLRNDVTIWGCTLDNFRAPLTDTYAIKYAVIEDNTILSSTTTTDGNSPGQGMLLKSDIQDFSCRRNVSLTNDFNKSAIMFTGQAQTFTNNNLEACYNTFIGDKIGGLSRGFVYNWQTAEGANSNPSIYIYRNNFNDDVTGLDSWVYTVTVEKNVVDGTGLISSSGTNRVVNEIDNIEESGALDASGNLTGTARTNYLGTHGAEIA